MLLLNNADVERVLTVEMTIDALESAYREFVDRDAICRPRIDMRIPTSDPKRYFQWGTMEGGSRSGYFAIRMKSDIIYEQEYNGVRSEEKYSTQPGRYCGLILLIDIEHAEPVALLNDGYLQHLRVAADGAIGVKVMSRPDASKVGMLGSGGMARAFAEAFTHVRPIESIVVFSPTKENREAYAREISAKLGIAVRAVDEPREVYENVDILASCTDSADPVVRGEWLREGTHVVSVGGRPDAEAIRRFDARLRIGTVSTPLGHPELAVNDEYIGYLAGPDAEVWKHIRRKGKNVAVTVTDAGDVTLGEVLHGRAGRTSPRQITYSERGNVQGLQFFSVAGAAYEAARKAGLGKELPLDWFLQDIRD
jgi:ornithine cyclodeaminase/alanine dehydrogenase-like protein (mu-crystallin family)